MSMTPLPADLTAASEPALTMSAITSERRAIEYGDLLHRHILVMRAAVVAWRTEGAEEGMTWIHNTLWGPGHVPNAADLALGAQALFDKEFAEHEAFRAARPAPELPAATTPAVVPASPAESGTSL